MLPIFVFPVMNEDMSIGMRKGIYKLKKKQHRYRFIVIPRENTEFFYSTNIFLLLPVLTDKYMKSLKGVSRQERIRPFLVVLSLYLPFRGGRSPPFHSEFSKNFRMEERTWRVTTQKEEKTSTILIQY